MKTFCILSFVLLCAVVMPASAQMPIGSPVKLDFGLGGGITLPSGDLSNGTNTGYNLGVKVRLSGEVPVRLAVMGMYHHLPYKTGGEAQTTWMAGGGIEYPIPAEMVKPYLGVDVTYNSIGSTALNITAALRGGIGLGGGIEFTVPSFGNIDASVKYQMINLFGKQTNETTLAQIAANVSVMFGLL